MGPSNQQTKKFSQEHLWKISQLHWLGHVSRMEDDRPVKSLLLGELTEGIRPVGRPKLRYKDTCKSMLKCGNALGKWKAKVENRIFLLTRYKTRTIIDPTIPSKLSKELKTENTA